MDNINESHSKLSYEELVKQNSQLKNQVKEIESESKRFESRFKNVIGNSHAGYFFIDNDGLFQEVNDAWLKLYKYDDSREVLGKHFAEVQQIDDVESSKVFVEGIRNQDPNFTLGEFSRKCKDGSIGYHSFSAKPVFHKNKVIGIEGFIIDITDRVATGKNLQESELLLNEMGAMAKVGGWQLNLNTQKLVWTQELYAIHEVDEDFEPTVDKAINFYDESSKKVIQEALEKAIESGTPFNTDLKIITAKGNVVDVRAIGGGISNDDGKTTVVSGTFQDITDKIKKEEELKKSHNKFKSLFDNIEEGVVIHKMIFDENNNAVDFVWIDANHKYEELTQLKINDIVGKRGKEVIPNIEQRWYDMYGRVTITGKPETTIDYSEYLDKYWEVKAFRPEKGYFAVAMTDVTDKVKAESLISNSEAKYRALYEHAPLSYQSLDIDGNFIDINPAWLSTLGYKREEVIGKSYSDFLHPDWKSHFETNFPEFKRRGYVSDVQFRIRHKKGHYIDISFEGCIGTHPDGSFKQTYCVFQDVTENKRIEDALTKNQYYLSKAQEMGKIGSWELDIINNKLIWTKENYKNFGVKHGTPLTYEIFLNCIHPEDRDYVNSEWSTATKGNPYDIEYRVVADGKVKWLREKANLKFDENGKAISAIGFAQDITKFKESESRLKESETILKNSEERFRELFDNMSNGVCIYDVVSEGKDFIFRDINKAGERIALVNKDDVIGKSLYDVRPNIEEFGLANVFRRVWKTGVSEVHNEKLYKDDELNGYFKNFVYKLKTGELVAIFEDLTEQFLAAKNIEDSEERFELAMKASQDGLYDWNLLTNEIYYSLGWKKMLGYKDHELPNDFSVWEKLVKPEDVKKSWEMQQELINRKRDRFELEFKVKHKNGNWIDVLSRAEAVFNNEGKAIRIVGTHVDVTEKIKSEERIAKSESIQRKMVSNIGDVVTIVDKDGINRYKSTNVKRQFGWEVDDLVGKSTWNNVHPDDLKDAKELFSNLALQPQKSKTTELRYLCKDGEYRWIEMTISNLLDDPEINGFLGNYHDITEWKEYENDIVRAKRLAEESEAVLKTTLQTAMDGYWVVDMNGRFLVVNDAYCRMSGYDREAFLSMRISDIEAAQSPEEVIENMHRIKQLGQLRFESKHVRKDGTLYDVEMGVQYQQNKDGQFVCFIKDISERKKHEQELIKAKEKAEENELRFKTLHDASFGGIAIHEKGIILDCNHGLSEITGFSQKELMGMNGLLLINEDTRDTVVQNIATEYYEPYEVIGVRKNGEEYPLRLGAKEIPYKSKKVRVVEFRDITFQKKIEKQLISSKEKAEESDRLKSAFLANMSHEIRTPMNGILGFTELLQNTNLSVENQKNYINIIQKSSNRLLNTVNDIIEISKIESGQINVAKSEVYLIRYLDTLVTFFRSEAEKKNLEIVVQNNIVRNDLTITTDKTKLESILSNIIKNAIKYTDVGTIKVGFKIESGQILFSCQDSGIGIPKNRLEAIFNRFEQADIDDKQAQQGSGLGLAIVKSYVEMMDGEIWVESEEGLGSIFYVSLPYNPVRNEEQDLLLKDKTSDSGIENINILIVEDEEYSLMHLEAVMNGITKNVSTAQNGIEAVDACKNDSSIDLILMDMKMPKMDGHEATRQIREFNKDVIIVAQTAFAFEEDKRKAQDAGCTDYISKPIKKEKLVELISKYF